MLESLPQVDRDARVARRRKQHEAVRRRTVVHMGHVGLNASTAREAHEVGKLVPVPVHGHPRTPHEFGYVSLILSTQVHDSVAMIRLDEQHARSDTTELRRLIHELHLIHVRQRTNEAVNRLAKRVRGDRSKIGQASIVAD
jgi:hypothetical protein